MTETNRYQSASFSVALFDLEIVFYESCSSARKRGLPTKNDGIWDVTIYPRGHFSIHIVSVVMVLLSLSKNNK